MLDKLALFARYGLQALLILPALMSMISEAVEAVEAMGGPGTGAAKKKAVLEAVDAALEVAEAVAPGALGLERTVLVGLSSNLVETVIGLQKSVRDRGE
jgi:hypothetical protein